MGFEPYVRFEFFVSESLSLTKVKKVTLLFGMMFASVLLIAIRDLSLRVGLVLQDISHRFISLGNATHCWISDKIGMIVSMVTPISLALVFNILCLTKNIYAIRRLQKVRSITKSRDARLASHQS